METEKKSRLEDLKARLSKAQERKASIDKLCQKYDQKIREITDPENSLTRKESTHRKVLFGIAVLKLIEKDKSIRDHLNPILEEIAHTKLDRWLVGLIPDRPARITSRIPDYSEGEDHPKKLKKSKTTPPDTSAPAQAPATSITETESPIPVQKQFDLNDL